LFNWRKKINITVFIVVKIIWPKKQQGEKKMKRKKRNWMRFILLIPVLLISGIIFWANPAKAASDDKKNEIEQKAMDSLENMGEFLRTLKSFSINSDILMDDVLLTTMVKHLQFLVIIIDTMRHSKHRKPLIS
jgi:NADH:ubiquinone oxidoreductase subunit 6 (subunit J)